MSNWLFGILHFSFIGCLPCLRKWNVIFQGKLVWWWTIYVAFHGNTLLNRQKTKKKKKETTRASQLETTTKIWMSNPRQIICLTVSHIKSSSCFEANKFALPRSELGETKNYMCFERLGSHADLRWESVGFKNETLTQKLKRSAQCSLAVRSLKKYTGCQNARQWTCPAK